MAEVISTPGSATPSRPPTSHPNLVSQTSGTPVGNSPKLTKSTSSGSFSNRVSHPAVYHAASSTIPYGCEHTHAFARSGDKNWRTLLDQYSKIAAVVLGEKKKTLILQTHRVLGKNGQTVMAGEGQVATRGSLKPTWLCVQCPSIWSGEGMKTHWGGPKQHSFFVESRTGYLFCANCDDFIYDPQLETIRQQKGSKKRKFDDYAGAELSGIDDSRHMAPHTSITPCRAIGLRGLYNMGNTCFMSVVIQSLLHNPFLRAFYLSRGHRECKEEEREKCTSCALDEIFTEFHSHEKTEGYGAVPMLIRSWKSAEHLAGYQQQDAHEYMQFILNSLHSANGGSGDNIGENDQDCTCIIHRTFYGKLRSTVTCDKCKGTNNTYEPFVDLSLDIKQQAKKQRKQAMANGEIPSKKDEKNGEGGEKGGGSGKSVQQLNLQDCLASFTSEEKLAAADYTCSKCDENCNASKQLRIKQLPPVLCIHLKRFSHLKDKSSKLETTVSFPLTLDMAPYTSAYKSSPLVNAKKKAPNVAASAMNSAVPVLNYALSAVIVHKGEINSGHYVSYAREGRDWFLFDDSKVVLVSESDVLTAEAYLLVYVVEEI